MLRNSQTNTIVSGVILLVYSLMFNRTELQCNILPVGVTLYHFIATQPLQP